MKHSALAASRLVLSTTVILASLCAFTPGIAAAATRSAPARKAAKTPPPPTTPVPALDATVVDALKKADYRFTPEVEAAFLSGSKTRALKELAQRNITLPADFLAWVDSDPVVTTTVYGARQDVANMLLWLRSLEIDLGQDTVRRKYTQLALAMAVVHARQPDKIDISPRPPLALKIGGDPRVVVNTKPKDRPLDVYDHVINFLNNHAPIPDDGRTRRVVFPELKYDAKGEAIQENGAALEVVETSSTNKPTTRKLIAADIFASPEIEKEFNDYMKANGQTVQINCTGAKRLTWNSRDTSGVNTSGCMEAYKLFLEAYKAKGYLPKERDPTPTPAERCAFLIRNHETVIPADKKIAWPKFPLTAPWPVLTMLASDAQPLRECQDLWERYSEKGEFHGYGEYVGNIAQGPFLQVRRLAPYAFSYGSVQMKLKDGGVCGTMAGISVGSHLSLGVPASTAGQPGHCAMVKFSYNPAAKTYACQGGQYATAGDAGTGVHCPWFFGDVDSRRSMVNHQSVAWSVNHGLQAYLDSTVAHTLYRQLPEPIRMAHATPLLQSAAALCPYNFLLVDDAIAAAGQPANLIAFWQPLKGALAASSNPGCPTNGLYNTTIKNLIFARLIALPIPTEAGKIAEINTFLTEENCDNRITLAAYKVAQDGLGALLKETETAFKAHLASARTSRTCQDMVAILSASLGKVTDKPQRRAWAAARLKEIEGTEMYFSSHRRKQNLAVDPCCTLLAKQAGVKPRTEAEMLQTVLDRLATQVKSHVESLRTPQSCTLLAAQISGAAAKFKDPALKAQWLGVLSKLMEGKETYTVTNGKKKQHTMHDPVAETIKELTVSPPAAR